MGGSCAKAIDCGGGKVKISWHFTSIFKLDVKFWILKTGEKILKQTYVFYWRHCSGVRKLATIASLGTAAAQEWKTNCLFLLPPRQSIVISLWRHPRGLKWNKMQWPKLFARASQRPLWLHPPNFRYVCFLQLLQITPELYLQRLYGNEESNFSVLRNAFQVSGIVIILNRFT